MAFGCARINGNDVVGWGCMLIPRDHFLWPKSQFCRSSSFCKRTALHSYPMAARLSPRCAEWGKGSLLLLKVSRALSLIKSVTDCSGAGWHLCKIKVLSSNKHKLMALTPRHFRWVSRMDLAWMI